MKESVIYAAGNPDGYPVEYYNEELECYCGVIPQLLEQFSQKTDYEVKYYRPGPHDVRKPLADNLQVDLISGCKGQEEFRHKEGEEILSFETEQDGRQVTYQILVSENAPENLGKDLRAFFSDVTRDAKMGLLLKSAEQYHASEKDFMKLTMAGVSFVFVLIIMAAVYQIRRFKKKIVHMEQLQETDEVTGIGNGEYLERYYRSVINDKNRVLYAMFYFYVDTEKMEKNEDRKSVNLFLAHMAAVLQEYSADLDILARVADGGFVLFHQIINMQETEAWLLPALERIRTFSGQQSVPEAYQVSVGIYFLKSDDKDLREIVFNGAQSAQAAYHNRKKYQICTNDVLKRFMEERKLQGQIKRGLEQGEFELYIQFFVEADTYQIVGGEALSRWNHPEKGLLSPGRYVPLMEKEDMVDKLDYYSLEKVCAFLERIERLGIHDFFISCNFSRGTFSDKEFAKNCEDIIKGYEFDRQLLIFEITESAVEKNPQMVRENIRKVKELGVQLVLDDFGDGFTSFLDIQDYPLDGLKLDKSLIDNIGTGTGEIILRSIIQVGHELGITVLGEGVENDDQVKVLKSMGCDVFQGFRFHYPIPEWEALRKLLKRMKEGDGME